MEKTEGRGEGNAEDIRNLLSNISDVLEVLKIKLENQKDRDVL